MSDDPGTPDGRYFVVKGRLWRKSDPRLPPPTWFRRFRGVHRVIQGGGSTWLF